MGRVASSSKMSMAFANGLPGADGPELKNFDPLKFSESENLPYFREAELKHGRIAMLATAGWIHTEYFTLPDHAVGSIAAHDASVANGALIQVLGWVSLIEIITTPKVWALKDGKGEPGNYSFDPLGLGKKDFRTLEVKELKNGRLAMMAFSGLVTQAVLSGKPFPYI